MNQYFGNSSFYLQLFEMEQNSQRELSTIKQSLEESEKQLTAARSDLERREAQITEMTRTIRDVQRERSTDTDCLRGKLKSCRRLLETEKEVSGRHSTTNEQLKDELRQLNAKVNETELALEKSERRSEELSRNVGNLTTELERVSVDLDDTRRHLDDCRNEVENRDHEIKELGTILKGLLCNIALNCIFYFST